MFEMDDRAQARGIVVLALAVTVSIVVFSPVVTAINDSTGTQSVTNETVAADYGSYVELTGYNLNDGETVYGFNDTSGSYEVASENTDYVMNQSDGSIEVQSGSSLIEDGEDVKVTYDYQATGSLTTTIIGFVPVMLAVLIIVAVSRKIEQDMG